ncbi:hypothetical protein R1sor_021448 [Riccia sorocarpa]|uniref:PGG domain-containing protein n=1 Tax=Riccia sorocarpa TaxID=122646 RepID=A0ABD3GIY3_9MARC
MSALHMAAEEGNPELLRTLLETGKFDPHYVDTPDRGDTFLHAAVHCKKTFLLPPMLLDYVEMPDRHYGDFGEVEQDSMLMGPQLDKEERRIPDPGPDASPDYCLWWYEKLTQETQDRKSSFNSAAAAISVTAALVATASYVGPLQPPLGYSLEDVDQIAKIQAEVLPVRVFFVCNTIAFYLAIIAVVFSLTPSLPVPHESTRGELNRMRRSVTLALVLLILSLVAILSAFASASIVVIPNKNSWNQGWLTASSVIIGSVGSLVALFFSGIRAVRLLCHNNSLVALERILKRLRVSALVEDIKLATIGFGASVEPTEGDVSDKAILKKALRRVWAVICPSKVVNGAEDVEDWSAVLSSMEETTKASS